MPDWKKRLYYEKITGKVIYEGMEMHGDVPPQISIEKEIEALQPIYFSDKNINNIGCKELEQDEYKEEFISGDIYRINSKNNKIKFYRNVSTDYQKFYYNEQPIKETYTEEDIYNFYYNHYINFNLKQLYLANDPRFSFKWYSLDEINVRHTILNRSWYYYFKDGYLSDCATYKTNLAKDILDIGTYWPLKVSRNKDDGLLYVHEGNHRVLSAKLLQMEGLWDNNYKWLCIEFDGDYQKFKMNNDRITEEMFLPKLIRQRMPFIIRFGVDTSRDDKKVLDIMEANNMTFIDEHTIELEPELYQEFISVGETYPHWLRDILYNFKQENGRPIIPSPVINNKDIWDEWIKE